MGAEGRGEERGGEGEGRREGRGGGGKQTNASVPVSTSDSFRRRSHCGELGLGLFVLNTVSRWSNKKKQTVGTNSMPNR